MIRRLLILGAVTLPLGAGGPASVPFPTARVHLEQNATDGDVEVVFEVTSGAAGLAKLAVAAPNGRSVIDFTAPDAATLGMREFRFESPEPRDAERVKAAYPEGVYTFNGATPSGDKLQGTATLGHSLPAPPPLLRPRAGAQGVSPKALEIAWTPVRNARAYVLVLEQDALNFTLTGRLPASVARFAVPDGFLVPGREYTLAIGTVAGDGNIAFVETTFTTAGKE
jgi:hypothetical protein